MPFLPADGALDIMPPVEWAAIFVFKAWVVEVVAVVAAEVEVAVEQGVVDGIGAVVDDAVGDKIPDEEDDDARPVVVGLVMLILGVSARLVEETEERADI